MSSDIAIRVTGLSKCYQIYDKPRDRLLQSLFRGKKQFYREFWALKDVSFEVKKGETMGIVGRNGSGKSTLLQLLCGILTPTCGELSVSGRVAALLELGTGFNPEFNGRENVFLNAAILGLGRDEIEERYEAIAAFADIGGFIDQPVKTYSSGMYARLAFAAAIHVNPEILVVDEILSVGDEAFQRKCFAKIESLREQGVTVFFVSHSAASIVNLCSQAILLDHGERLLTATPKTVIGKYQKLIYAPEGSVAQIREEIKALDSKSLSPLEDMGDTERTGCNGDTVPVPVPIGTSAYFDQNLMPKSTIKYVSRGAIIKNVRILDEGGKQVNILSMSEEYSLAYEVFFTKLALGVRCVMLVKTIEGITLGGILSHAMPEGIEYVEVGTVLLVEFKFKAIMLPGIYFMNAGVVGVVDKEEGFLHRILDAAMFRIDPYPGLCLTGDVDISAKPSCRISLGCGSASLNQTAS